LRIVTVVPSLARNTGGPAVTLVEGTRAMGDSVRRVIYATDAAQPAAARPFKRLRPEDLPNGADQVKIRLFPTRPPFQFGFSPALWRALQQAIPAADLVTIHSVNLFPQLAAYTTALRCRVPYIVTPHGALDPWLSRNSPTTKRLNNAVWQNKMLTSAAAVHFTTEDEAALAAPVIGSARPLVIPNGVDLARFSPGRPGDTFRSQRLDGFLGLVVLFLGRVARKKGIDLLIRAFAHAPVAREAMLVIAGPDDEDLLPWLRMIAVELGVHDRVRFVGPVYGEDQLDALAAADIWALTSHTENFGNAVVEALAAGLPVIVSTEVNLASQIEAADAGIVTPLDIPAISQHLQSLLAQPQRRELLGQRGAAFARRFDWSIVAPELVSAFEDVASRV
jgi:glycosyltransferase involved in cell wall biosynthesis